MSNRLSRFCAACLPDPTNSIMALLKDLVGKACTRGVSNQSGSDNGVTAVLFLGALACILEREVRDFGDNFKPSILANAKFQSALFAACMHISSAIAPCVLGYPDCIKVCQCSCFDFIVAATAFLESSRHLAWPRPLLGHLNAVRLLRLLRKVFLYSCREW